MSQKYRPNSCEENSNRASQINSKSNSKQNWGNYYSSIPSFSREYFIANWSVKLNIGEGDGTTMVQIDLLLATYFEICQGNIRQNNYTTHQKVEIKAKRNEALRCFASSNFFRCISKNYNWDLQNIFTSRFPGFFFIEILAHLKTFTTQNGEQRCIKIELQFSANYISICIGNLLKSALQSLILKGSYFHGSWIISRCNHI